MKLSQVLNNFLVTPAYHTAIVSFHAHGNRIRIRWECEGQEYDVTVEDQDIEPGTFKGSFVITDEDDEVQSFIAYTEANLRAAPEESLG